MTHYDIITTLGLEKTSGHQDIIKFFLPNCIIIITAQQVKQMLSQDQIRILSSMVLCIPLSYVIPKIPSVRGRQVYSFVLGTLIQLFIYGRDIWMIFALHTLVYIMAYLNPKNCGKQVTIISLALLSIYHVYRMIVDYGGWTMDVSTIMMSNVNKYSLFAFAVQDGHTDFHKLTKEQVKERIDRLPSYFRFLGYCQFLPCSPISLAFPYKYFEDYIYLKNQYANIPSPWKAVGYDVGYSLILVLFYVLNIVFFPLSKAQDPSFSQQGFWYIVYYSFFCVTTLRFKYYFGWKLSMGAVHASGISYQQHGNGQGDFKLIQTCHPEVVESTVHVRQKIANWNMTCQEWLRKCVYERVHFKNKIYSQLITFLLSAFWHGFYGGYYFSFILWFAQMFVSQLVFKESKKEKSPWVRFYKMSGIVGKIGLWLLSNVTFTVSGIFFQVLSIRRCLEIMKALYFAPVIVYSLTYILFTFGATRQKRPKNEQHEQAPVEKHKLHAAKSLPDDLPAKVQ